MCEQIESILAQKGGELLLTIRNDGSADKTRNILKEVEENDKVLVIYGENIDVGNAFMELIYHAEEADYYSLVNKDDV